MAIPMCRRLTTAGGLAAALGLSACMTVVIEARDGPVRIERGVGFLRVELPPAKTVVLGSVSGVGLASTPLGLHVGYARQRWAVMGQDCGAVVWFEGATPNAKEKRWLATLNTVCSIDSVRLVCLSNGTCARGDLP